ncbi:MAG: extracellular solute-binding protein [Actinomycetales bacterium]|nr:extracellular solute-binding protein [Actinomycetales bacterium]
MRRTLRLIGAGSIAAAVGLGSLIAAPLAQAKPNTIVIWTDADRAPAVRYLFPNGYKGLAVDVVVKDFGAIRDELSKVTADSAPDVIMGANDWVGELAVNGSIVKLNLSAKVKDQLSPGAVQAFNYNGSQYGVPVAIENIAMITNASLIKTQPTTFADLSTQALALQKAGKVTIPLAVQQGAGGDAYHMYPLFTGLGGYIFGTTPKGAYVTSNIGIDNKVFRANSKLIDQWNKTGLLNSKVDGDIAKAAFTSGQSPFWITGPWNISELAKVTFKYRITPVPPIVDGLTPVPFIGSQGVMLTKYAAVHGVESAARSLVTEYMAGEKAQFNLSAKNDRYPANLAAAKRVTNPQLKAFGAAGAGGVPIPNISQMNSVWGPLGGAWVNSTKGEGATPAAQAFAQAAAAVKQAVAG